MGEESLFLVFARKKYDEPLSEIGAVTAGDRETARRMALENYADPDWLEMIAIPQQVVVSVIEGESA